ncbi:MAG: hypothetical protein IT488_03215 [Gammaproteobacteria bacterium]|nr:hypothetical protein [Gammaproteobacteria bacterium]
MELDQIRTRGRGLGLNEIILQGSKRILIQAIQQAEGRKTCFLDEDRFQCRKCDCEWRADCQKLTAAWRR